MKTGNIIRIGKPLSKEIEEIQFMSKTIFQVFFKNLRILHERDEKLKCFRQMDV